MSTISIAYGATTFTSPYQLTLNNGWDGLPAIFIDNNNIIHTSYMADATGITKKYLYKYKKPSTSWSKGRLLATSTLQTTPVVMSYNKKAYIVINIRENNTYKILLKIVSSTGTVTTKLVTKSSKSFADSPSAAIVGNKIYISWIKYTDPSWGSYNIYLYLKKYDITSGTFGSTKTILSKSSTSLSPPKMSEIKGYSNNLHITWNEGSTLNYLKTDLSGNTLINKAVSSSDEVALFGGALALDGNTPYIAYTWFYKKDVGEGKNDIKLAKYVNGEFVKYFITSDYATAKVLGDLSIYSGKIKLVYSLSDDIYFKNGSPTNLETARLTNTPSKSENNPAIALDTNYKSHIIYMSNADGDYDIYYRKQSN